MTIDRELNGRARLTVETAASPERAFAALVDSDELAAWFGAPTSPLAAGGQTRIEFGDGDFFDLDGIRLDRPHHLAYSWRFLGLGPRNLITWTVAPGAGGCARVTVTDDDERRSAAGVAEMIEGWGDFTDRLVRHLATGQRTRYDWRRDLDGGVELPVAVDAAAERLLTAEGLRAWQPWRVDALTADAKLRIDDGATPSEVTLLELDRSDATELRLVVGATGWKHPTQCTLAVRARADTTLLTFRHVGWEEIADSDEEQRRQRERFCRVWVESLKRAQMAAARP